MSFSLVTPIEMRKHRAALRVAHEQLGVRRAQVEEILSSKVKMIQRGFSAPALCVGFDRARAAVEFDADEYQSLSDAELEAMSVDGADDGDSPIRAIDIKKFRTGYVHESLRALPGSVPGNKRIGDWTIGCGVCLIVGLGGQGKTPLAHALAGYGDNQREYGVVRIGEPMAGNTVDQHECALAIGQAMLQAGDVVLDSIKDLVSGAEGAAMKSGISRGALTAVSAWSTQACELGVTLYVPINPSTDDPEVLRLLTEIARSNATTTIYSTGSDEWSYSGRTGEGLPRVQGTIRLTYDKDGAPQISTKPTKQELTSEEFTMRMNARIADFGAATSRAISKS